MRGLKIIGIAAAVTVAGVGALSGTMPASAQQGDIGEVSGQAAIPGLATEFGTVTIVDGATGDVTGSRPNVGTRIGIVGPGCTTTSLCLFSSPYRGYQGAGSMAVSVAGVGGYTNGSYVGQLKWKSGASIITGPKASGPVSISGGPVTVVSVTIF